MMKLQKRKKKKKNSDLSLFSSMVGSRIGLVVLSVTTSSSLEEIVEGVEESQRSQ
jgi:hypothetical protein